MQADRVFVLDIYAASEKPIEGVTGEALAERMRQFGHKSAAYVPSLQAGAEAVSSGAEEGDMIITLGAGSVSQAGELILDQLRQGAAHA
jgi:UDP-N-acetylmuramate--alanine ligase